MDKNSQLPPVLLLCESEQAAQIDRRALRDAGFPVAGLMTSGIEAARLLAGMESPQNMEEPGFVVCSQKLADMDGEQFCAIIRQHPLLLGFPIVLILPNDSEAEQLKTLGCGASALLGRPYSVETLKNKLTELHSFMPNKAMLKTAANQVDTSAFDQALATYGVLLRPSREPDDYFKVGMRCLEERRWNLAISAFEHALAHAQIKAEAELGMAVAFKGKGDMASCKDWLGKAAMTFIAARRWHHARAAYAKLLRHDPQAKNPFISEAHRLIRSKAYEAAANVLAQGASVLPREEAGNRYAQLCFVAEDPDAMLAALETGLSRGQGTEMAFLGDEIRASLETMAKEKAERQRLQAIERKWQLSRQKQEQQSASTLAKQTAKPAAKAVTLFAEDEADFSETAPGEADMQPGIEPLSQEDAVSELFEEKPRLNELLSVMKLTWKLARRAKNK